MVEHLFRLMSLKGAKIIHSVKKRHRSNVAYRFEVNIGYYNAVMIKAIIRFHL